MMPDLLDVHVLDLAAWRWGALALAAVAVAVMDTLYHHHSTSVFRAAGPLDFWGDASHVWRRRYVGGDPGKGYRPYLKSRLARVLILPVHDGWHLAKAAAVTLVIAALAPGLAAALLAWAGYFAVFELFYAHLLRRS